MDPATLIKAFALPALAVTVWCALVWMPWSKKRWGGDPESGAPPARDRVRLALTLLGALVSFAFSHRVVNGQWAPVPPTIKTSVNDWFFWMAVIASVFASIDLVFEKILPVRIVVRTLGAAAVASVPVVLLIESGWYTGSLFTEGAPPDRTSGPLWMIVSGLVALASWFAFSPRKVGESRLDRVVPLGLYLGVVCPAMVTWSVAINAQFLGGVALAMIPVGLITLWRPSARAYDAVYGYATLMAIASLTAAYHFAEDYPHPASALLVALAPLALFLMRVPALAKRGPLARTLIASALVMIPAVAGVAVSGLDYAGVGEEQSEEDALYDELYGHAVRANPDPRVV